MSKTIEVTGCEDCPYFEPDVLPVCDCMHPSFEYGHTWNADIDEWPIPSFCPLKKESITIKIKDDEKQENIKNAN